jgi:hypothetical protein
LFGAQFFSITLQKCPAKKAVSILIFFAVSKRLIWAYSDRIVVDASVFHRFHRTAEYLPENWVIKIKGLHQTSLTEHFLIFVNPNSHKQSILFNTEK